jgi:hypothetical protein
LTPLEKKMNDKISDILAAFETFDGTYKRAEVDAALALQDEITPHLIGILENVLAEPVAYAQRPNYFGHIYAIQLLGHFVEPRAHDVIVDLASLPPEIPHDLFGDTITESLAAILFGTCGGSIERIRELLLNPKTGDFCRSAAARALVYAAVEGTVPREEILALFGSLFTGDEADSDSDFWAFVASSVCDLYPEELMEVIKKGFEDSLISGWIIDYAFFEETLRRGKARAFREVRDSLKRYTPANFHDRMSWWACFRQEKQVSRPSAPPETTRSKPKRKKRPKPRPTRPRKKRRKRSR